MKNTILDTFNLWSELVEEQEREIRYEIENGEIDKMTDEDIEENALDIVNGGLFYDTFEYITSDLDTQVQEFISRFEKRYNTDIQKIAFIGSRSSYYGSIGGAGRTVGRIQDVNDFTDLLYGEQFKVSITEASKLQLSVSDHDGTNYMEMVLMTENEVNKLEELGSYDVDCLQWLSEHKNSVKLDKKFISNFSIDE